MQQHWVPEKSAIGADAMALGAELWAKLMKIDKMSNELPQQACSDSALGSQTLQTMQWKNATALGACEECHWC